MVEFIKSFIRRMFRAFLQAHRGSRSTALWPLQGTLMLLVAIGTAALKYEAPPWILTGIFGFCFLFLLLIAVCYLYLLANDRDAVRSERFYIQKQALERGMLLGDSSTGLIPAEEVPTEREVKTLSQKPDEENGE